MASQLSSAKVTISVRLRKDTLKQIKRAALKQDTSLNKFFVRAAQLVAHSTLHPRPELESE